MSYIKIVYGYLIETPDFDEFLKKKNFVDEKITFFGECGYENIQTILGTNIQLYAPVYAFTNVRQNKIIQDYTPYSRIYLGVLLFDFEIYNVNRYHEPNIVKYMSRYRDAIQKVLQLSTDLSNMIIGEPGIHCVYNNFSL